MAATALDLFRSGNASGARLDHVRTGRDVDVWADTAGQIWVSANGKGISVWEAPDPAWAKVWRLPAGATIPAELMLWTDVPGHWVLQPSRDMLLTTYEDSLRTVNGQFVRV